MTTTAEHPNMFIDAATWVLGEKQDLAQGQQVQLHRSRRCRGHGSVPQIADLCAAGHQLGSGAAAFHRRQGGVPARRAVGVGDTCRKRNRRRGRSLKMTQLPFPVITGGASNSLHIPAKLDAQKKKLVWEFIVLAATPAWQEKYVQLTGSPAGRVGMISAEQAKRDPHSQRAITQAAEKAENLFPTQSALRENYNEFATLFSRAVVRMQSSSQPTDARSSPICRRN